MMNKITNLPRIFKQLLLILVDSILLIVILFLSYSIRLDYWYYPTDDTIRLILLAPIIGVPIFVKLGLIYIKNNHLHHGCFYFKAKSIKLDYKTIKNNER